MQKKRLYMYLFILSMHFVLLLFYFVRQSKIIYYFLSSISTENEWLWTSSVEKARNTHYSTRFFFLFCPIFWCRSRHYFQKSFIQKLCLAIFYLFVSLSGFQFRTVWMNFCGTYFFSSGFNIDFILCQTRCGIVSHSYVHVKVFMYFVFNCFFIWVLLISLHFFLQE